MRLHAHTHTHTQTGVHCGRRKQCVQTKAVGGQRGAPGRTTSVPLSGVMAKLDSLEQCCIMYLILASVSAMDTLR